MQDTPSRIEFIVCQKCGVAILSNNQSKKYWLVKQNSIYNVVRCPKHITEWSLRQAGLARSNNNIDWMMKCREKAEELERWHVI